MTPSSSAPYARARWFNLLSLLVIPLILVMLASPGVRRARAAAAPGGVSSGLDLWLDAADPDGDGSAANNPADGANLTTWTDKSGNVRDATVLAGKNAATYSSSAGELINGQPVVRFTRVNDTQGSIYDISSLDIRAATREDVTIFTVYRPKSLSSPNGLWGIDNGGWDRFFLPYHASFGDGVDDGIAALGPAQQGAVVPDAGQVGQVRLLTAVYDGAVSGGVNSGPANGSAIYFGGDVVTHFTDSTAASAAQANLRIGWDGDSSAYDGDIAEMIVYNRVLSNNEIEQVNIYLGGKYNQNFSSVSDATLTTTDATSYPKGGSPIVISPNLTVTSTDALDGALVLIGANFATGDTLGIEGQSGSSGTVSGITWSYNATSGLLTLTGAASAATYQSVLRQVTFSNASAGASSTPRGVRFSLGSSLSNSENGHFYEFVVAPNIHWDTSKTAAASRNFFGLQGYLTTVTSASENDFIASKLVGQGWMGASDDPGQGATEGHWFWASGPEAGTEFFDDTTGLPVNGAYNNWQAGEPNNAGGENYAHFLASGKWNDYANTTSVNGYVVEYGGMPGDPTLQIAGNVTVTMLLALPTLDTPPAITGANAKTYPVSGTCIAGMDVVINVGGIMKTVTCAAGGAYSTTLDVSSVADGSAVAISVTQTDGVVSSSPATATVAKDTSVAAPTIAAPAANSLTDTQRPTFTGTAEPGTTVTVKDGNNILCTATTAQDGSWSCTPASDMIKGAHIVSATATNAVGTTSAPTTRGFSIIKFVYLFPPIYR